MAAMRPAPAPSPWQARITAAKRAYSRAGAAITLMLVVWVLLALLLQGAVAGMLHTPQLSMWLSVVISSGVLYCIAHERRPRFCSPVSLFSCRKT